MFKLELDISMWFTPPMNEESRGITITRTLELPFPPTEGLNLTGIAIHGQPMADGFMIKEVTWDLDRQVFLAQAGTVYIDFPIASIPDELRSWLARGWRLGNHEDAYGQESGEPEGDLVSQTAEGDLPDLDDEELDRWPTMSPRSRSPAFNKLLRAMIREMARLFNNSSTAYAMDQTKMFFTEKQLEDRETRATTKFRNARSEFEDMSFDQQYDWREKVLRTHPRLDRVVVEDGAS